MCMPTPPFCLVDLESRHPDVLKEFPNTEAAVAFEEECYQKKTSGEFSKESMHRIPKSQLSIGDGQKPPRPTPDEQHSDTRNVVRKGLDEAEERAEGRHMAMEGKTDAICRVLKAMQAMGEGKLDKQLKLEEIMLERAKAKAEKNEAFARRVEEGGCTELAQAELELALAQAKVRKIKDEHKIAKTRSKAEAVRKRGAAQIGEHAEETMRRKRKKMTAGGDNDPSPKSPSGSSSQGTVSSHCECASFLATTASTPSARGQQLVLGSPSIAADSASSGSASTKRSDAGGAPNHPPEPTREQLVGMIRAGHRREGCEGALTWQRAQAMLRWAAERLDSGDPYTVTMAGKGTHKLPHLKLMFGLTDENGMLPIYNFGLTKSGWKRVAPMPDFLQERAKELGANSCVINIYPDGAAHIAFHQD